MQSSGKIKVGDLNELLTCMLCNGYYIDATTIIECLHSFCKTCIVTYLQTNKYCPKCEVQVHKTRPLLNIRSDQTLQDIVYKVVPGLFKNEMKQRRDFYSQQNALVQGSIPSSSEKRGDVWGCDRLIFTPEDIISISLEYCPVNLPLPINLPTNIYSSESLHSNSDPQNQTHRRYLRCPAAITVYHLKKFLRAKYGLNQNKKLDVLYMHDILKDQYTLIDLAYIYSWKRNGPLRLFYKVTDEANNLVPKTDSNQTESIEGVSLEVSVTDSEIAASSSTVTLISTAAPVATAPSSRHPSPPPSPQMAAEPNYVKIDKPNSAALLNEQATKVHQTVTRKSSLKSSLSSSKVENMLKYKPYVVLPILRNSDSYSRSKFYEDRIHSDNTVEDSEKEKASPVPKKKTVTFSVDLVQTFYENSRYKSSKHSGKSSIFRTTKVNRSPVTSVMNMRNGILMGKRS